MRYTFDPAKNKRNLERHGVDFAYAARIFHHTHIEWEDNRYDYGERRFIVLGRIDDRIYVVVYTWRNGLRRIISARRANSRERDVFHRHT
jgi:hypothetical protein